MSSADKQSDQTEAPIVPDEKLLAAMVEFSAAAGHEINNPLAVILGRTELLLRQEQDPARRQSLQAIAGQALRIRDMIGDVMIFADPPAPVLTTVSARTEIQSIIGRLQEKTSLVDKTSCPTISLDFERECTVQADSSHFCTVITEILQNALHPSTAATKISIELSVPHGAPYCEIRICDDGKGLSNLESIHLFSPFYSGRQAGRGLGFGLSKAWRLAQLNQARLSLESAATSDSTSNMDYPESKTTFLICWPLSA